MAPLQPRDVNRIDDLCEHGDASLQRHHAADGRVGMSSTSCKGGTGPVVNMPQLYVKQQAVSHLTPMSLPFQGGYIYTVLTSIETKRQQRSHR